MKKDVTQKPNPIYAVIQCIQRGETTQPYWITNVELKKSKGQANYYLIALGNPQLPPEAVAQSLQIEEHHISVYQYFSDKHFGLTAYHYTATIIYQNRRCYLHGYFDKYGILQDILLQDETKATMIPGNESRATMLKITNQFTVVIMTDIFDIMDNLSEEHDKKLEPVRKKIDHLSRIVFAKNIREETEAAYNEYMEAIRRYIALQEAHNKVCFDPDLATLSCLRHAEKTTKPPKWIKSGQAPDKKIVVAVKEDSAASTEVLSAEVTVLSSAVPPREDVTPSETDIVDKSAKKLKVLLQQLNELDSKMTTASTLCHEYQLINQCLNFHTKLSYEETITLFIRQNNVIKRAKIALNLVVFNDDDADSASQLLSIVKVVRHDVICQAALRGSVRTLSLLLEKYRGPKMILYRRENGLHYDLTIMENLPNKSLERLLAFGCNPNALSLTGFSLLHDAVSSNDLQRVCILLDAKANINERQEKGHLVMSTFEPDQEGGSRINKQMTKKVVNLTDELLPDTGRTPMMLALRSGYLDIARLLVGRGCDLSIVDNKGLTFQSYGLMRNPATPKIKEEVVKYLVEELKVDINKLEGLIQPQTALHFAVQYHATDDAELLLKYGADPNAMNRNELDPRASCSSFSSAARRKHFDMITLILTKSKIPVLESEIIDALKYFYDMHPAELKQFLAAVEPCPYVTLNPRVVNIEGTDYDTVEVNYNALMFERVLADEDVAETEVGPSP